MKKNIMNILNIKLLAVLGAVLLISSCSDGIKESSETSSLPSADGRTYICIGGMEISSERSISTSSSNYDASKLTNFTLKGKVSDSENEETLATAEKYNLISGKLIPIEEAGSWTFTLTAKLNGASFTGTATKDIVLGSTNSISFNLISDENYGGMSIKMTFVGTSTSNSDYRVVATLQNEAKTETIETKTFTTDEIYATSNASTNKSFYVTYERSPATESTERLASGTYYLLFEFFDTRFSETVSLNTSRNFVRVDDGLTTTAALSITLNEVYTITYNDGEGTLASGVKVGNYSRKSDTITLPTMTPTESNTFFAGWYTTSTFDVGTKLAQITSGTTGNLTLYARYCTPDLYVDGTNGAATGVDGLASDSAFKTLDTALSTIQGYQLPFDWTIHIANTVYGTCEIPDSITTTTHATSLTLAGTNGDSSDTLSAKENADSTVWTGTTLSVKTSVPVTITDLTITDGKNSDGNGGGLYIASGATVTLGDEAVITGNTAKTGSGVYVSADSTFKMGGSAIVESDYDVYLDSDAVITIWKMIDGNITTAALITPSEYANGKTVLVSDVIDGNEVVNLGPETLSFAVSPNASEKWGISAEGKLEKLILRAKVGETNCYRLADVISEIEAAEGTTTIVLYNTLTASDIGKAGTSDTIINAIKSNSNTSATFAISVDSTDGKIALDADCSSMFESCSKITSIDMSGFDTSAVTDMSYMFYGCSGLTSLVLTGFTTTLVTDMKSMFQNCTNLETLTLSANFDTSNVTSMYCMFNSCSKLSAIDLSSFVTTSVTDSTYGFKMMFMGCSSLTTLDVSTFEIKDEANISEMFKNCSNLTTIYAASGADWLPDGVSRSSNDMFTGCTNLSGYSQYNVGGEYAHVGTVNDKTGYFTAKNGG